jgi:cobalt-zinc-cadmium efflux system protein
LLRDSFNLAMDAVPQGIDPEAVKAYLAGIPGVTGVHDLHIWAMSTTETALTAHLVKPDSEDDDEILEKAGKELHDRFGIEHTTIQWERRSQSNQCGRSCEIPIL